MVAEQRIKIILTSLEILEVKEKGQRSDSDSDSENFYSLVLCTLILYSFEHF
jgi:hypothetical protein